MRVRALIAAVLVLLPGVAAACPTCLNSAYGDRTFNWAFLGLLFTPFVVAAAIGAVLIYAYRASRGRRLTRPDAGSPRAGGQGPADALRLTRPDAGSPRAGGQGPADALRLTRPHAGSPRAGGPEPTDALRLTRPPLEETT